MSESSPKGIASKPELKFGDVNLSKPFPESSEVKAGLDTVSIAQVLASLEPSIFTDPDSDRYIEDSDFLEPRHRPFNVDDLDY